jgi:hypothetical protein
MSPGEKAVIAYNICINECGAPKLDLNDLDHFVEYFLNTKDPEWRFQGNLGFGGKLYHQYHKGFYVSCYAEDEPRYRDMIDNTNRLLKEIGATL